ncbi:iron-containing alcohol dehydrogenase [Gaoshiqia sediminis]|uniref:Iron-containing alcohol dehydrogenase n=1 Tax=Gaoshiqia sediminis TaxID=2986998 RepID=A0AA41Y9E2_9BACT|nr:iron-containing alcohol dehydrogenase [Gaoshiqia sediminis]MCW0481838.1 iron-containing alcohol dehydrogenase [Gaoshiqia sediminis]
MKKIIINNPSRFVFGNGSLKQFVDDFLERGFKRMFLLTIPVLDKTLSPYLAQLTTGGVAIEVYNRITNEPTFAEFEKVLALARNFQADAVVGIGGGSVLDTAKLVAAQIRNTQTTEEITGIGMLKERKTYLACLPTTSGTGSEVSPNAIFLDESDQEKKGVISPYLMPDAAYIDPILSAGVPPAVTAATGMDAFAHCLEAFVNRFAHPVTDRYALDGMQLIFQNLKKAYDDGSDLDARANVSLGSVYGGMCLGPVNTTAVHALAYPLGSKYKVPHGLSNAVILPWVMEFNLPAATEKYARVAKAIGITGCQSEEEYAQAGIRAVRELMKSIGIPAKLRELGIPENALEDMAVSALKVQRLLKNNVREVTLEDALEMYKKAY